MEQNKNWLLKKFTTCTSVFQKYHRKKKEIFSKVIYFFLFRLISSSFSFPLFLPLTVYIHNKELWIKFHNNMLILYFMKIIFLPYSCSFSLPSRYFKVIKSHLSEILETHYAIFLPFSVLSSFHFLAKH